MKVLIVHNYYQSSSPSGEDAVFENECALLSSKGVGVVRYVRHNDEISCRSFAGRAKLPFENIWSGKSYRGLKALIKRERPDVAHFHNIFYLISPSAYYACKEMGVPVVQTLHNFRIFCANGLLYRDGGVCEECVGRSLFRGAMNACYRDSRAYSTAVALMEHVHEILGTWDKCVDAYIALTDFGRRKFIEAGLPAEKIRIKPNFLPRAAAPGQDGGYALFAGRVSREKGVFTMLEAWRDIRGIPLKILGAGPSMEEAAAFVKRHRIENADMVGRVERGSVPEYIRGSKFLVFPSRLYEGFPMAILEAYASGKAVVASNRGAVKELVKDGKTGFLFKPEDPFDLAAKVRRLSGEPGLAAKMGENAMAEFEGRYTPEKNFESLISIYKGVAG